jgi:predicted ATPase/DNA-binding CsgD family transcriptional regulator
VVGVPAVPGRAARDAGPDRIGTTSHAQPTNLPAHLTELVGRERELTEVRRLLRRARLVTLTGAGGVGKTRLATAVADELGETFADGVAFVDLAPVSHPSSVPPAIARALGIRDDGDLPLVERLANALHDRELLLILDNFEHVLPAAPMVLDLLKAAPRLTALVTSRAALRVRGEREFPVAPLGCPALAENEAVGALLRYPALALFVQRAQDVRPDFTLGPANAASVAEICRRLDGLPLALELAAARIRILSPEAMLGRLGQGLALLTGGPRDLPARQQTLRATIAWSHDLLSPDEQALFRRLAVFAGDFSLDAATVVAAPTAADAQLAEGGSAVAGAPASALDLLTSLVEKNLLWQEEGPESEPRFRMLETVREFGLEQLEARGEADIARRLRAAFFVAFVEEAAPHLRRSRRERWLRRVDAEMDNLRSVVEWSSAGADGGDALIRIVGGLSFLYYWRICAHLHEGWRWCELALATPAAEPPSADRMRLLWTTGALAGYMGRHSISLAWLEESVRLARASGDGTMLGYALIFLGRAESHLGERSAATHMAEAVSVLRAIGQLDDLVLALNVAVVPYLFLGDLAAARAALAEGLAAARELGDDWAIAVALSNAGFLDLRERKWSSAGVHLEQALALHLRLGDEGSVAVIYNNLAIVARHQGDDAGAVALLERSLAQQRRLGLTGAITLFNLGDWALRQHETSRAMTYLAEALRVCVRSGEQRGVVASLGGLARLAVAVGQPDVAARLIGGAEALRERASVSITLELRRELEQAAAVARSTLGEQTFRAAVAGGESMPLARLTADALVWVESLPSPGPDGRAPMAPHRTPPATPRGLSPREVEVLRLIAGGKSNREIAAALVISLNTVARHVSNIFDKVGATNRTEAAAYAHRQGIAR